MKICQRICGPPFSVCQVTPKGLISYLTSTWMEASNNKNAAEEERSTLKQQYLPSTYQLKWINFGDLLVTKCSCGNFITWLLETYKDSKPLYLGGANKLLKALSPWYQS